MNLGNIFKRDNQNIKANDTVKVTEPMSKGERAYRVQSEIRNLTPGQTIQGSVVSRDGTAVQIALRQDLLINARIDQSISLALGQSLSFEVKANNGSILSLTPLYANMANEATVLRALNAAGFPDTANNVEMVAIMMKEGMPIDRESLANINRLLMEFPRHDPETLIQMTRLGVPITEVNIEQFEQYRSVNHQLLGSSEAIMSELPDVFQELMSEGRTQQAYAFYENVLDIFTGEETEGIVIQKGEGQAAPADPVSSPQSTEGTLGNEAAQMKDSVSGSMSETVINMAENEEKAAGADPEQSRTAVLTPRQWNTVGNLLKELDVPEHTVEQIKNGELPPKEVLSLIRELIPKGGDAGELHDRVMDRLLGGRAFESLLKAQVESQWTIKPENVADPRKMEQLYERIREQSTRLHEALQAADKADMPVAKSVQNLQSNVDFMNQLNHMFTYIQLPLKMAGGQAHGDLYVYTNKKNLAAKDGNVSALLHLDMQHLGAVDVYVAMQQNRVSTNFTLQDESALDLIEQHISLLDERLAGRGYDLNAQFHMHDEAAAQDGG
ncbi:MAG: flagellar hook-length control protein FliK, partial [Lachnospiraceae bacterium]|nr:flagellar hook-length control protein FliK [Lachnospiraceae bacterium]